MVRSAWVAVVLVACGGGNKDGTGETGLAAIQAVDDDYAVTPLFPVVLDVGDNDVGELLKIVDITEPSGGSEAEKRGARTIDFLAAGDFEGTETFQYTVRDELGREDTATVTVEVGPAPSITIDSPADGTTLTDDTVTIEFTVEGCPQVATPSSNPDGCHVHIKVDGSGYSGPDGEGQGHYTPSPIALAGLDSGQREIELRLVTNVGTDAEFRIGTEYVYDRLTVTVP